MTVEDILHKVRELSNVTPKTSDETSAVSEKIYGVGLMKLRDIARAAKRNHERALGLWASGVYEGKILATLTEAPKQITQTQLNEQVRQISTSELADYFAKNVVAKTDFLLENTNEWTKMRQPEWVRRVGYACVCLLAKSSKTLDNNYFCKHLTIIELEIKDAPNWVKEGQKNALIAIGSRNATLNKKALRIAANIGKITVQHSNTKTKITNAGTILSSEKVQHKIS